MKPQRAIVSDLSGGINRAVAQNALGSNQLHSAVGVFQKQRKTLDSCYESASNQVTFTDAAVTITGQKKVPLRTIYWEDDGKLWQLLSTDYQGNTSLRRQDTDREYDNFEATGAVYQGYLILGGTGEQALAIHSDYSANRDCTMTAFTYTSATGVVSAVTFAAGDSMEQLIVGDIWERENGTRHAITDVRHGYTGTAFTYTSATGVVSSATFDAGYTIGHVQIGDVVTLNGTPSTVTAVSASTGTFTVASGLGAIASGNFSSPSQFTVASGLGAIASGNATIERFRPIRLGSTYYTTGTVTVTAGSKTVTGSGTTFASTMVGSYITFSNSGSTTWSRANIHPRSYKIASFRSTTEITLEDEYEGTALSGDAYRIAYSTTTTAAAPLQISQPFIYKDRLFAVGADPTANGNTGDYNVLYMSGYPGSTSTDSDIFDFVYWDVTSTSYPIGVNAGAIQRPVPLEDRVIIFCQNGVFELRGIPPVDAAQGSDLTDRQLAQGIGLNAYDAVVVAPDRQTVYWGSQSGIYRLYSNVIETVDQGIRDHELYTFTIQYAALYDNRLYFSDGTDDQTRVVNGTTNYPQRNQYVPIWIYDLLTQSWTVDQRIYGVGSYTGTPTHDYGVKPLYTLGRHGGIMSPYQGRLTGGEYLLVGTPGGCVYMNEAGADSTDLASLRQHAAYVASAGLGGGDNIRKRIWALGCGFGRRGASTLGIVTPSDAARSQTGVIATGANTVDGTNFRGNGLGGGYGNLWQSVGVGYGSDTTVSCTNTSSGTKSWAGATSYLVWPMAVPCGQGYRVLLKCKPTTVASDMAITVYALDSSRTEITHASVDAECWAVSDGYYWYSATLTGGSGTAVYVGVLVPTGNTVAFDLATSSDSTYTIASLGAALSLDTASKVPISTYRKVIGSVTAVSQLESLYADLLPMPGMKQ